MASPTSRRTAIWRMERGSWRFGRNTFQVPAVSWDDYRQFGYQCAIPSTRHFLRRVAGVSPSDRGAESAQALLAETPTQAILSVMEYLYEVLGGSPRWLLSLVVRNQVAFPTDLENEKVIMQGLDEALGATSRWGEACRRLVNEQCARLIGSCLLRHRTEVESIFFREVRHPQSGLRGLVAASTALVHVRHLLLQNRPASIGTLTEITGMFESDAATLPALKQARVTPAATAPGGAGEKGEDRKCSACC